MPYRFNNNRFMRRKDKRRSRYTRNAKYNAIKLDKKFNKKIRKMNDMIELKWLDTAAGQDTIDTTGTMYHLSNLDSLASTGIVSANSPIGAEVHATSVHIRGLVYSTGQATTVPNEVRLILLWDRQSNGTIPSAVSAVGPTTGPLS